MAIASLVLGILGFCTFGITAIAGLILGIFALIIIKKSRGRIKGNTIACAGIGVSFMSSLILPITLFLSMLLHPILSTGENKMAARSMENAKRLCMAMHLYASDNNDRLPPVDTWQNVLLPYFNNNVSILGVFPGSNNSRPWAMNVQLEGSRIKDIDLPERTVLIFEAKTKSPPAGGPEILPEKPFLQKRYIIGFVDGHIEYISQGQLDNLIWFPSRNTINPPYFQKRRSKPNLNIFVPL